MNRTRRLLLRGTLSAPVASIAIVSGLLRPKLSWAWTWPVASPFLPQAPARAPSPGFGPTAPQQQKSHPATDLLRDLRGKQASPSGDIRINAPEIAEDGANVFLEVFSSLPQVDGFVVFADRNPEQLVAVFWIGPEALPEIKTRIKMAQTGNIWVMARSQGRFFSAYRTVKVTVGGCGVGQN